MKSFIYILFAVILFLPAIAQADMLPEGMRGVDSTARIDNVTDYPAYDLYLGDHRAVKMTSNTSDENYLGDGHNEFFDVQLFAVKKTNAAKLKPSDPCDGAGCYDNWFELPANKAFIIPSDFHVKIDSTVPDASPIVKERFVIHVDNISSTSVKAHVVKAMAYDKEGREISLLNNAAKTPLSAQIPPVTLFIAGMAVAAGLIALGMAFQKWKK